MAQSATDKWSQKMVSFVAPVIQIYSLDLNKEVYSKKEKAVLSKAVKDLQSNSHSLKFSSMDFFSKKDPVIKAEYLQFKNNLDMAEKALAFSTRQSVNYVRGAIGQCAACHSNGGKSTHLFEPFRNSKISDFEKGRLALALRDYQSSADIYRSILLNKDLHGNYFKINDLVVSYLNVSILSERDNTKIIIDLKKIIEESKNPAIQKDLNEKIKDVSANVKIPNYKVAIQKYKKIPQNFSALDKKIFTALKVKNKLHEELRGIKSKSDRADVYSVLGDIYSNYKELSIFMVPEAYYELCIKEVPKTAKSQKCFKKYSSQITFGYSGSMGTNIPAYETEKINKLKAIAFENQNKNKKL